MQEKRHCYHQAVANKKLKKMTFSSVSIYERIRSTKMKKLYLTKKDSKILGICGSIGETYDIDPTVVRILTIFLCLSTGIIPLLLTYLIAWIIMPKAPKA